MRAKRQTVEFRGPPDPVLTRLLRSSRKWWDSIVRDVERDHAPVTRRWSASKTLPLGALRLIRRQRTVLYLLPEKNGFRVAFVFGERATTAIREGGFPTELVAALNEARVYAEGRGLRLEVRTAGDVDTVRRLAAVKLAN
jgi:hypothetical protein